MAIVTDQLKIPAQVRIPVVIALCLAAGISAILIEKRVAAKEQDQSGSRIPSLLSVAIAAGAIALLVHRKLGRPPFSVTSPDKPAIAREAPPIAAAESVPLTNLTHEMPIRPPEPSKPADTVLDYVKAPVRSGSSGTIWPVVMYGEDGSVYPLLRANAELAVRNSGRSAPSIFNSSVPSRAYEELFAGNAVTLAKLQPYCDGLILSKIRASTSASNQFEGMFTTVLVADVKIASVSEGVRHEFNLKENGTGFSAEESKANAEERLATKLATELAKFFH